MDISSFLPFFIIIVFLVVFFLKTPLVVNFISLFVISIVILYFYNSYLPFWFNAGTMMCMGTGFGGIIMTLLKNPRFTKYEKKNWDTKKFKGGRYR